MTGPHRIQEALRVASDTRAVEIGRGAIARAGAVFRGQFAQREAVVVADAQTMAVAGRQVSDALAAAGIPVNDAFVFDDPDLYAEHGFVERLEGSQRAHAAIPVAVGSGTINDIVKLAAHRTARPYMAVATAASMDGYTAFGASITHNGSKQTFECPAPAAVIADIDVIAAAPKDLSASGYADLLAKVTAGADWIVADALGVEPIDPTAWRLVQDRLHEYLADPAGVARGDVGAIARLTEGLLMGGFAMQWTKSSRTASGAEHQFSHLWDMQHHVKDDGTSPSHGFKVGIGTLAVARLYERLMNERLEQLDVDRAVAAWPEMAGAEARIRELFEMPELRDKALLETQMKWIDRAALRQQLERLKEVWPALRKRLSGHLIASADIAHMLSDAGAPTEPREIGISAERLRDSHRLAYYIRRRYTVLDLAERTIGLQHLVS